MQTVSVQSDLFGNPKRTAGSAFKYPLCGSCAQPLNNCQEGHRLFTFVAVRVSGLGSVVSDGILTLHNAPNKRLGILEQPAPLKALFHP